MDTVSQTATPAGITSISQRGQRGERSAAGKAKQRMRDQRRMQAKRMSDVQQTFSDESIHNENHHSELTASRAVDVQRTEFCGLPREFRNQAVQTDEYDEQTLQVQLEKMQQQMASMQSCWQQQMASMQSTIQQLEVQLQALVSRPAPGLNVPQEPTIAFGDFTPGEEESSKDQPRQDCALQARRDARREARRLARLRHRREASQQKNQAASPVGSLDGHDSMIKEDLMAGQSCTLQAVLRDARREARRLARQQDRREASQETRQVASLVDMKAGHPVQDAILGSKCKQNVGKDLDASIDESEVHLQEESSVSEGDKSEGSKEGDKDAVGVSEMDSANPLDKFSTIDSNAEVALDDGSEMACMANEIPCSTNYWMKHSQEVPTGCTTLSLEHVMADQLQEKQNLEVQNSQKHQEHEKRQRELQQAQQLMESERTERLTQLASACLDSTSLSTEQRWDQLRHSHARMHTADEAFVSVSERLHPFMKELEQRGDILDSNGMQIYLRHCCAKSASFEAEDACYEAAATALEMMASHKKQFTLKTANQILLQISLRSEWCKVRSFAMDLFKKTLTHLPPRQRCFLCDHALFALAERRTAFDAAVTKLTPECSPEMRVTVDWESSKAQEFVLRSVMESKERDDLARTGFVALLSFADALETYNRQEEGALVRVKLNDKGIFVASLLTQVKTSFYGEQRQYRLDALEIDELQTARVMNTLQILGGDDKDSVHLQPHRELQKVLTTPGFEEYTISIILKPQVKMSCQIGEDADGGEFGSLENSIGPIRVRKLGSGPLSTHPKGVAVGDRVVEVNGDREQEDMIAHIRRAQVLSGMQIDMTLARPITITPEEHDLQLPQAESIHVEEEELTGNDSQKAAIKNSLTNRLSLIQGPPGTGKTKTAVELIDTLLAHSESGEPILATAQTNAAVDNLVRGLVQKGRKVARSGDPNKVAADCQQHLKRTKEEWKGAEVICATCIGSGGIEFQRKKGGFHTVLVDECSQAAESLTLIPICLAAKRIILVGDQCQLEPFRSAVSKQFDLGTSLFNRLCQQGIMPVMLNQQYRMHPGIAEFPAAAFYASRLSDGVTPAERPLPRSWRWPSESTPVCFVDAVCGEETGGDAERKNLHEVQLVLDCLSRLLGDKNARLDDRVLPQSIGVVTPYLAQKATIEEELGKDQLNRFDGIEVNTVDAFQGREKEIIVFSAVRANQTRKVGFLYDWRRMNVMLTRARCGLILIGNRKTLNADWYWQHWLQWAAWKGCIKLADNGKVPDSYLRSSGSWAGRCLVSSWVSSGSQRAKSEVQNDIEHPSVTDSAETEYRAEAAHFQKEYFEKTRQKSRGVTLYDVPVGGTRQKAEQEDVYKSKDTEQYARVLSLFGGKPMRCSVLCFDGYRNFKGTEVNCSLPHNIKRVNQGDIVLIDLPEASNSSRGSKHGKIVFKYEPSVASCLVERLLQKIPESPESDQRDKTHSYIDLVDLPSSNEHACTTSSDLVEVQCTLHLSSSSLATKMTSPAAQETEWHEGKKTFEVVRPPQINDCDAMRDAGDKIAEFIPEFEVAVSVAGPDVCEFSIQCTDEEREDLQEKLDDAIECFSKSLRRSSPATAEQLSLPLYTDNVTFDGAFLTKWTVIVKYDREEGDGVVGSLPEWGSNFEAYIPNVKLARRATDQMNMLLALRRGQITTFAAEVEDCEARRGHFFVTLSRESIRDVVEQDALERWRRIEGAAGLVDTAARNCGVDLLQARRAILYKTFEEHGGHDESVDRGAMSGLEDPRLGAVEILRRCGNPDESEARTTVLDYTVAAELPPAFCTSLLELCTKRRSASLLTLQCAVRFLSPPLATKSTSDAAQETEWQEGKKTYQVMRPSWITSCAAMRAAGDKIPKLIPELQVAVSVAGPGVCKFSIQCVDEEREDLQDKLDDAIESFSKSLEDIEDHALQPLPAPCTDVAKAEPHVQPESTQPTLTIGVIGDVAHGKTTTIKTLTNQVTQKHSSERRAHGATLRLGHANCLICRCPKCPEAECFFTAECTDPFAQSVPCKRCDDTKAPIVKRVSFVDCPGHAELMGTMLSGLAVFDAVLFVAAADAECPTLQAKAHIEALSATSHDLSGNVAVIQSKTDLIVAGHSESDAVEVLQKHRTAAIAALHGIAEDAPVFPTAALHGHGLSALAKWLASLQDRPRAELSKDAQMPVLRRYDTNRPGTSVSEVKGLVFGGSLCCGQIQVGDNVELRPGRFEKGSDGSFYVQPVQTRIETIQSGDNEGTVTLAKAAPGGLVALQTMVCPSFSADPCFDASVIGPPDTLPPIWQDIELEYTSVAAINDQMWEKTDELQLRVHAGSACAEVTVTNASNSKLVVRLMDRPLCVQRNSNLAIERIDGKQWVLCAHGRVVGGTQCHPGKDSQISHAKASIIMSTPPVPHCDLSMNFVKSFLASVTVSSQDNQTSISEDTFNLHREGKASFLWQNFLSVMEKFDRKPDSFIGFLKSESNLDSSLAGEGRRMLRVQFRGYGLKDRLQSVLEKFVETYVKCRQCGSYDTHVQPKQQGKLECRCCKAQFFAEAVTQQLNIEASDDPTCRYKMPALVVQVRGSGKMIRTVLCNINDVTEALCCCRHADDTEVAPFVSTPETILRFFSLALGTDADIDSNGVHSLGGSWTASKLQDGLREYIDDFVCCPDCHRPGVALHFDRAGSLHGRCPACPWQGSLALAKSHSQRLSNHLFKKCTSLFADHA